MHTTASRNLGPNQCHHPCTASRHGRPPQAGSSRRQRRPSLAAPRRPACDVRRRQPSQSLQHDNTRQRSGCSKPDSQQAATQQRHSSDTAATQQRHSSDTAATQQRHSSDTAATQQRHSSDTAATRTSTRLSTGGTWGEAKQMKRELTSKPPMGPNVCSTVLPTAQACRHATGGIHRISEIAKGQRGEQISIEQGAGGMWHASETAGIPGCTTWRARTKRVCARRQRESKSESKRGQGSGVGTDLVSRPEISSFTAASVM
jgi:hypothetical protein